MTVQPYCVGISGPSGAGKSSLVERIIEQVGADVVSTISADWYYLPAAAWPERLAGTQNYDHPDVIEFSLLQQQLHSLRRGDVVQAPRYDFATHQRLADTTEVHPRPLILIDGILLFHATAVRDLCDLRVWIEADPDTCLVRRIRRDTDPKGARQRTHLDVMEQYEKTVRPMFAEFVAPCRRHSHIIMSSQDDFQEACGVVAELLQYRVG